jgi:hypothetical protein
VLNISCEKTRKSLILCIASDWYGRGFGGEAGMRQMVEAIERREGIGSYTTD